MALFTESSVRACIRVKDGRRVFYLGPGDRLTPSAREWLRQERIEIVQGEQPKPKTYETLFGGTLTEKPEQHDPSAGQHSGVQGPSPRIEFRGQIDLLEAELLLAQRTAMADGREDMADHLQEILDFVRSLIRADVLDEPVQPLHILGLTVEELRERSHAPQKYYGQSHFMPSRHDAPTLLAINKVRTVIRQVERAAYRAFRDENGAVRGTTSFWP